MSFSTFSVSPSAHSMNGPQFFTNDANWGVATTPSPIVLPPREKNLRARRQNQSRHGNHLFVTPMTPQSGAVRASPHLNLTVRDKQEMADHSALPLDRAMAAHLLKPPQSEGDCELEASPASPMTAPAASAPPNSFDFELLPSAVNARRGMKMAKLSTIECKYGRKCYRDDCRFAHSFVERQLFGPAAKPLTQTGKKTKIKTHNKDRRSGTSTQPMSRSATSSPIFQSRFIANDSANQWPRGQPLPDLHYPPTQFPALVLPPGLLQGSPNGLSVPTVDNFNAPLEQVHSSAWPSMAETLVAPSPYGVYVPSVSPWMSPHPMPSVLVSQPGCRSPPPRPEARHRPWPQPQGRV